MGWKEFYKIDQNQFERMYNQAQTWGDLYPFRVTAGDKIYYGAGAYAESPRYRFSPSIAHPVGIKTRITIKYLFIAKENAPVGSRSIIGIVFYKNSETSKDQSGHDFHGVQITVTTSPPSIYIEEKTLVVEQENNRITIIYDDVRSEYQMEPPLQSFKLGINVDSNTGIVIYEVKAEYYDQLEDIFNMMFSIMITVMFIMMGVMFVSMIIRAFRGRGGE